MSSRFSPARWSRLVVVPSVLKARLQSTPGELLDARARKTILERRNALPALPAAAKAATSP